MNNYIIPSEKINEIRYTSNIIEIISQRINLKKNGQDFWGLCPFHNDTNPSLKINSEKSTWYCFGCNKGGDIFTFLMFDLKLSFPDAVHKLANYYGITISKTKTILKKKTKIKNYYIY